MKVLAGIVLFNPDIDRLMDNILAIFSQVDGLVLVDNGSANLYEVKSRISADIKYIENQRNLGIAEALNGILNFASDNGYDWIITLDHDSICSQGLIEQYKCFAEVEDMSILTCKIVDRNFNREKSIDCQVEDIVEIVECITSGSFCSVKALKKVGGFDNQMFIDGVDFDICATLRENGCKIFRINFEGLLHEVGQGKNVKLFGRQFVVFNHSPLRNYYMARNDLYLLKKHPKRKSMLRTLIREFTFELLIMLHENKKFEKIKSRWRGILDSFKMKIGE